MPFCTLVLSICPDQYGVAKLLLERRTLCNGLGHLVFLRCQQCRPIFLSYSLASFFPYHSLPALAGKSFVHQPCWLEWIVYATQSSPLANAPNIIISPRHLLPSHLLFSFSCFSQSPSFCTATLRCLADCRDSKATCIVTRFVFVSKIPSVGNLPSLVV